VVHLSFGERSAEPEIREESARDQDPLAEGISATLESIRRQIEEGAGKVEAPPPPEGAEPEIEDNPAVVGRHATFGGFQPPSASEKAELLRCSTPQRIRAS
jgi:hypothetical protein